MTPSISFGPNADRSKVTAYSLGILNDILIAAGIPSAQISSTQRDPFNQARVMFANIETKGVEAQKALYREPGHMVIDAYVQAKQEGKDRDGIIAAMEAKVIEVGPYNVSHHAADPKVLNVFDVAPSSIPSSLKAAFENAVRADKRVQKFLEPPSDPGYHLEIHQP
jgi:hypothetical protein